MIRLQEGRNTHVISGICLYRVDRHEWVGAVEVSVVRFRPLADDERSPCLSRLGSVGKESRGLTASRTKTRSSRLSAAASPTWSGSPSSGSSIVANLSALAF